jgi:hypothetical protein
MALKFIFIISPLSAMPAKAGRQAGLKPLTLKLSVNCSTTVLLRYTKIDLKITKHVNRYVKKYKIKY